MGEEELFQAKLVSSDTDEKKPVAEELSGVPMFVAKPGIKYLGVSDRDLFQLMIQGFLYCGGRGYHGKYIGSAFRFLPPKRASKWLHSQLEQDCKPVLIELEQTLPTKTSIVGCHEVRCAHFCSEGEHRFSLPGLREAIMSISWLNSRHGLRIPVSRQVLNRRRNLQSLPNWWRKPIACWSCWGDLFLAC